MDEELIEEFLMDMEDLLKKLSFGILTLEKDKNSVESLNEIFRVMHSLKGISAMMELSKIEDMTHNMESLLFEVRDKKMEMNDEIINLLSLCNDYLENFVANVKKGNFKDSKESDFIQEITKKISGVLKEGSKRKKRSKIISTNIAILDNKTKEIASNTNNVIYKIKLTLKSDCAMKKIRAYLIFLECKNYFYTFGEIPSIIELEKEESVFENSELYLSVITENNPDFIKNILLKIGDIEDIIIEESDKSEENIVYNFKQKTTKPKFDVKAFYSEFSKEIENEVTEVEELILKLQDISENINKIFRSFNTITGLAKMIKKIEIILIAEESLRYIDLVKNNPLLFTINDIKNILFNSTQLIKTLIDEKEINESLAFKTEYHLNLLDIILRKQELLEKNDFKNFIKDVSDVSSEEAEQLINMKKESSIGLPIIKEENGKSSTLSKEEHSKTGEIRVNLFKIEKLNELINELQIIHSVLEEKSNMGIINLNSDILKSISITKEIQKITGSMSTLTLQMLFQKMNRIFNDSLKKTNKKANFYTSGENIEIDRVVLEKISEPMIHIVKNSISHGIEESEERLKKGKSEIGLLEIKSYTKRNSIYIEINDDGKGIDIEEIYRKCFQKKFITKKREEYSEQEILNFLFIPGFSTADKVDEMSGRGVGMDVVKSEVEKLGGKIFIESIKDKGTTLLIRIPVNNMVINGIIVEIDYKKFIIPTPYINEIFEKNTVSYIKVMDKNRYLKIRNDVYEIIDSKEILGIEEVPENVLILLESFGIKKVITVDKIIGRRDISLTNLNLESSDKLPFVGATILGDGKVYLILDIDYILNFKNTIK